MTTLTHEELAPTVGDGKTVYRILDTAWNRERQVTLRARAGGGLLPPRPHRILYRELGKGGQGNGTDSPM